MKTYIKNRNTSDRYSEEAEWRQSTCVFTAKTAPTKSSAVAETDEENLQRSAFYRSQESYERLVEHRDNLSSRHREIGLEISRLQEEKHAIQEQQRILGRKIEIVKRNRRQREKVMRL